MKLAGILLAAVLALYGAQERTQTEEIVALYQAGNYSVVCRKGMLLYYAGNDEPHFAAMVGMACAKVDEINPLGALQRNLVATESLRKTATYFSTLVLEKRLLYQYFIDGLAIDAYVLPKYDHVLSVVYDHIGRGDYKPIGDGMLRIDVGGRSIFVSVSDDDPVRILVDEYEGASLLRRHWFQ